MFLATACRRASEVSASQPHVPLGEPGFRILVRQGRVHGLADAVARAHAQVQQTLRAGWQRLRANGVLVGDVDDQQHSLEDATAFVAHYFRDRRRASKNQVSATASRLLWALRDDLARWLAQQLDIFLVGVYMPNHFCDGPAPPAHWARAGRRGRRQYVDVDASQVWKFMEQARRAGCSLRQVLQLRQDGQEAPVASLTQAEVWTNVRMQMYFAAQKNEFQGCAHLNIVADPATCALQWRTPGRKTAARTRRFSTLRRASK